jgi:hypothetical protein
MMFDVFVFRNLLVSEWLYKLFRGVEGVLFGFMGVLSVAAMVLGYAHISGKVAVVSLAALLATLPLLIWVHHTFYRIAVRRFKATGLTKFSRPPGINDDGLVKLVSSLMMIVSLLLFISMMLVKKFG